MAEIHSSENGLDTSFKISISPQVRLFIMVLCFFLFPGVWSCSYGMLLELCCFGFLARSVLFPVGKGGEQGAVSSIKIYIWFAVYAQSP